MSEWRPSRTLSIKISEIAKPEGPIVKALTTNQLITTLTHHQLQCSGELEVEGDGDDEDVESCCSTCSSSSSSDEAAAYALPPRRAYGGVRISYVPNDAVACAMEARAHLVAVAYQAPRDTEKCVVSWWRVLRLVTLSLYVPLKETLLIWAGPTARGAASLGGAGEAADGRREKLEFLTSERTSRGTRRSRLDPPGAQGLWRGILV